MKKQTREIWAAAGSLAVMMASLGISTWLAFSVAQTTGKAVYGWITFFALDALFSIDRQTRELLKTENELLDVDVFTKEDDRE